jgi:hypothetical protein
MTQRERSEKAWKKWRGLVSEQARSGQSVSGFCRERNLAASHFYWWKKRLQEEATTKFVKVEVTEPAASAPGDSGVEVRLRNGRSLIVGRGFDPEHLRALVVVVETAS